MISARKSAPAVCSRETRSSAVRPTASSTLSTMKRMNSGSTIWRPEAESASTKSAPTLQPCGLSQRRYSRMY